MEEKKQQNPDTQAEEARQKERAKKLDGRITDLQRQAHVMYVARENTRKRELVEEAEQAKPELVKKIMLLLIDDDWSKETGFDMHTTQEQLEELRKEVLSTTGAMELYKSYSREWLGLRKYARHTKTNLLYPYLLEVSVLFKMITQYRILLNSVNAINIAYATQFYSTQLATLEELKGEGRSTETEKLHSIGTEYLDKLTRDLPEQIICDTNKMNPTPYKIRATDEREIWANLRKQAKKIKKNMAELKAFDMAALEHANDSQTRIQHLPFFFECLWEWMPNNTQERIRFEEDEKYYKAFLNEKIGKGYQPTEEDIKWALIPDYREVTADKEAHKEAKLMIADYTETNY